MRESKGKFETLKFNHRRKKFYEYIKHLKKNKTSIEDLLEHSTAYIGHMSLNRIITLYEIYKKTLKLNGHIAELGVYKGSGSLLFAKLVKIFESESLTQVHGFEWFKGTDFKNQLDNDLVKKGTYSYDKKKLINLIKNQGFSNILKIHDLDISKNLVTFLKKNPHLRFKLVFLDIGINKVLDIAIPLMWERLVKGGILIFDQFNHELAPGETIAINKHLKKKKIMTIKNSWMPNAYIIK